MDKHHRRAGQDTFIPWWTGCSPQRFSTRQIYLAPFPGNGGFYINKEVGWIFLALALAGLV